MVIAIDFDGTCCTHEYPRIGESIGAEYVLKQLTDKGHQLILFTMRDGHHLTEAVAWFAKNNIPLYGVQRNPQQTNWTKSPKAYAELYIDDAALGCPLKQDKLISNRPFVDWQAVQVILKINNLI